jgi:hypothetical protein
MTRVEIHIDELVLRGLPQEYVDALPPLVERRLTELAQRREPVVPRVARGPVADVGALADLVARQVWAEARTSGWADPDAAQGGGA